MTSAVCEVVILTLNPTVQSVDSYLTLYRAWKETLYFVYEG